MFSQGWPDFPSFNVGVFVNALLYHERTNNMQFTEEDLKTKTIAELLTEEDIRAGEDVTIFTYFSLINLIQQTVTQVSSQ